MTYLMTYLWIGFGGALGSIMRAWLAVIVTRFTGPQFPWGTILINVVGSFVISFFGTLTANDSRFAASADLRAFVMVGICGGFTTFSSFSLQTLELARDGRIAQAMGNVGLSVALCLIAVTAGYASAAGVQQIHVAVTTESSRPAALVLLHRPDDARALIDAAARLLRLSGGGELRALIIHPSSTPLLPSEEVMTVARAVDLNAARDDAIDALRQAAQAALDAVALEAALVEVDHASSSSVAEQAAGALVVVACRPGAADGELMHRSVQAALFEAACPVLLLPPGRSAPFGRTVVVAWKNDPRAAAALRDALPLLQQAEAVHVLGAADEAAIPSILREAGVRASPHALPDTGGSVGERLLAATHELGADLLIMGAFTRGAWHEGVFGGVTRTMLAIADVPLFMRH